MNAWSTLGGCLVNLAMVMLLAPLAEGVLRKVTARIQSRQGPPLAQPYFDLLKLLGKEDIEAGEVPAAQRWAVFLSFGSILTVACLLPLGHRSPLGGAGDLILLAYLLTLAGISTLLAGLAAGSTYSLIGISREMMNMMVLEPLLAVALVIGVVHTGSLRLEDVLDGSLLGFGRILSGVLMLAALLGTLPAFVQRVPYDTAEAETELMDGPLTEYSGPKLALLRHAQMAKLLVYSGLVVSLFMPRPATWPAPLAWLAFWAAVAALVLLMTVVAASHARYRIDQAVRRFAGWLAVAIVALILATQGY